MSLKLLLISSFLSQLMETRAHGHVAHKTFMTYTYDDQDALGPKNWADLPGGQDTTNFCGRVNSPDGSYITPGTPLNIMIEQATLPIRDIQDEVQLDYKKPSLKFRLRPGIEQVAWDFGYPLDAYHGLEFRGPRLGLLEAFDSYDPPGTPVAYDFHFGFITFCDFSKASPDRSSHQLDGKRFPLEINFMFFSEPAEIGMDNNYYPKNNQTKIIMVSVLGQISNKDNPRLEPVLEAAKKYQFGDFEMDDEDRNFIVKIKPPFSPSWFLPMESQYFYYREGNFPVPPCFPLDQIYVVKDPIKISKAQLKVLTELRTEREPTKKFTCTFGLLRKSIPSSQVLYNPYPHTFIGTDNRPEDEKAGAVALLPGEFIHLGVALSWLCLRYCVISF